MKKFFVLLLFFTLLYSQKNIDEIIKLLNNQQYEEAIKLLESSDKQQDVLLSIAYLGKKEFSLAKSLALKCYEKNNKDVVINYILALIAEEEKDFDTAINHWNNVLKYTFDRTVRDLARQHIKIIKAIK